MVISLVLLTPQIKGCSVEIGDISGVDFSESILDIKLVNGEPRYKVYINGAYRSFSKACVYPKSDPEMGIVPISPSAPPEYLRRAPSTDGRGEGDGIEGVPLQLGKPKFYTSECDFIVGEYSDVDLTSFCKLLPKAIEYAPPLLLGCGLVSLMYIIPKSINLNKSLFGDDP